MSCASCHSPDHALGPPNGLAVQLGGKDPESARPSRLPSLKYLQAAPQFTEHFFESEDDGDESIDNGPTGGLTWDGRVDHGLDQARLPLLSPFEMANTNAADVVGQDFTKRATTTRCARSTATPCCAIPRQPLNAVLKAFEVFEQSYKRVLPLQQQVRTLISRARHN